MKKVIYLGFILTLLMAWPGFSQTVIPVVAGTNAIQDAYDGAAPGDILELVTSGGQYEESDDLMIEMGKPITVRAAAGLAEKPRWIGSGGWALILPADAITLEGLILDGALPGGQREVLIRCAEPEWYDLQLGFDMNLINCDFINSSYAIYGEDQNKLGTVNISGCTFQNFDHSAIQFNQGGVAPGAMDHFSCVNSTFWNIDEYAIYIQATSIDADPPIEFLVDHVTVHDVANGNIKPRNIDGAVIKNSIFTKSDASSDATCYIYGTGSSVTNVLSNNLGDVSYADGATSAQVQNFQSGVDPLYASPAGGNFTLLPGSPALNAGDDGNHLGDSRWWPENNTEFVFLTAGTDVISNALSTAVDGQTILLITDGGTYEESSTLVIDKDITLRVADGLTSRPTLISGATDAMIEISDHFRMQGIILNGALGTALTATGITNTPGTSGYDLTVLNCDFLNFVDAAESAGFGIFGDVSSVVDSVYIKDCTFAHILNKGISFKDPVTETGSVNYFEVDNCTFWDMNSEAIYVDGFDSDVSTPDPEFYVNKVTVYDCGSYNIIPHYIDGAVITNSMVVLPEMNTDYAPAKIYGSNSLIENFLYLNTRDIDLSSGASDFQLVNVVIQEDPLLIDPENGDFSYPVLSPAVLFSDEGVIRLGDDRWWPSITFPRNLHWGTYHNSLNGLTLTWANETLDDSIRWGYTDDYEMGIFQGIRRDSYVWGDNPQYLFDYNFPIVTASSTIYYSLKFSGIWGEMRTYETAVDTASSQFTFIAGGDQRNSTIEWEQTSSMAAAEGADFALSTGDIVGNGLYASNWEEQFYAYGAEYMETTLTYYTHGNHEAYDTESTMLTLNQFVLPGNEKWYTVRQGNTLFMCLYTEAQLSSQMSMIEDQLANTDATWTILFFHKPFFTSGGHAGEMDAAIPYWWKLFDDYGVDIIINGHDHTYTRSKPINLNVSDSEPVEQYGSGPDQGRLQMLTGSMGAPLYGPQAGWWLETSASIYNYVKFEVNGDELHFDCIEWDGSIVDSLTMYADGTYQTEVDDYPYSLPTTFQLQQNYPNPFNPTTAIRYSVPHLAETTLTIYDVRGSVIKSWYVSHQSAGWYNMIWNGMNETGSRVSSGIYFARLQSGEYSKVIKMVYLQ